MHQEGGNLLHLPALCSTDDAPASYRFCSERRDIVKTTGVLLLGAALLAGGSLPALVRAADEPSSPYEEAIDWIKQYCSFTPQGQKSLAEDFRQAESDGFDLEMVVGEGLMKCKTPYLLHVRLGRLYFFEIAPAQARALDTEPDRIGIGRRKPDRHLVPAAQVAAIKQMQIDGGRIGGGPITGQVHCRKLGDAAAKLCLQLWFRVPGKTVSKFQHLDKPLPEDGVLRFSFSGEEKDPEVKFTGPVAAFLTVGTLEDKQGDWTFHRHSNTIAAVVDYQPGEKTSAIAPPPPLPAPEPASAVTPPADEDVLPGKEADLPLEEPRQRAMRDKVVAWVKQHATHERVPDSVAEQIDQTLAKTNSFRYAIGADLNDIGKAYLIDGWDNRLFFFALSPEQAQALDLKPRSVIQFAAAPKQEARRLAMPLVRLADVRLTAGRTLGNGAKITGEVTLQASTAPAGKYVLRLSYRRGNSLTQAFHYLDALPQAGTSIAFSFSPINRPDDKERFTGVMPLYVDLCKIAKKKDEFETTIFSNTLGVLVDVVPGGD